VKRITLWRRSIPHRPGSLAASLALTAHRAGSEILMAYRDPADGTRAVLESWPPPGRREVSPAERPDSPGLPTLLVRGRHRRALFDRLVSALARANLNVSFLVHQVVADQFSALLGFESEADARRGLGVIRRTRG
jgi:hypothetical protein